MQTLEFPSTKTAWHFVEDAQAAGYHVRMAAPVQILPRLTVWAIIAGALVGGIILGLLGAAAEAGWLGLPRLEPLFRAPVGAITALLATIGGSLGAVIGGFIGLTPVDSWADAGHAQVVVDDEELHDEAFQTIAQRYEGHQNGQSNAAHATHPRSRQQNHQQPTLNRILAWLLVAITAAVLLEATIYIWYLALDYGHGADQKSRIGYTMKNIQRVPADTPEQAGKALAGIMGGATLEAPADPIAAAVLAPLAAAQGQTLVYGAGDATPNLEQVRQLATHTSVAVVIAEDEPAYAMPAAYAAALFRVPVIPLSQIDEILGDLPAADATRLLLVAAPDRLVSDDLVAQLDQYGAVERVAHDNIYRHALLWARSRWGDFGWGIDERQWHDGYYNFTLTNPEDPAFAAAGLPMAYLGNFGPLLYTPHDDLDEWTDQFLWRLAPDYFLIPSDGPFMNMRVVGGPDSVGYNAQARADLALETHSYRNEVTGMSGAAVGGWIWFFMGLAGFIWALFAMPRRIPDAGFYPRLYWPLAMLVLGPLGILAFFWVYQGRPVTWREHMPAFVRPLWAQAVSATIMGMGVGMALMIAAMYLFQYFGLPTIRGLAGTGFHWFGAPMDLYMWFLMVIPAIILSTFFFMGPMLAEMHQKGYWQGVRQAASVVILSMVAASIGMFSFSYWVMNWENLMAPEDLWLWVTPLWFAAAFGFLTALIPNYLMVRAGWKTGEM